MRVLAAALLLAGCASSAPELKIADVLADPSRYQEQTIELTGEVTDAFGLFSIGVYTIQDDSGAIRVMTSRGLPAKGVKLTVRGTVSSGVTIGAEHYGVALNEEERNYLEP